MKTFLGKLEFSLEHEVVIRAPRAGVFRFFTDSARFASWMGAGSTIDARAGGAVRIVYPGGTVAQGEVLELRPNERIVFSYGYESGQPIAPGGSRVTVTLRDHAQGTSLRLRHEVADAATRDMHVQGWRFQMALFANAVANEVHAGAAALADRWYAAWSEPDEAARRRELEQIASAAILFQDTYGLTRGLDQLVTHVSASQKHMPGIVLVREGEARQCQGLALVDWTAQQAGGTPIARGTNVFELGADGRIERVVGLWSR
jgi:uncharacterized protein YndB with AHSA1/START domain